MFQNKTTSECDNKQITNKSLLHVNFSDIKLQIICFIIMFLTFNSTKTLINY